MTALDRLTLTFMQIPMTEAWRMELHNRVKEAEEEQAEMVNVLRILDENGDYHHCSPLGRSVRSILSRFPSGPTG